MSEPPDLAFALWTTDVAGLSTFLERVAGMRVIERHPGFALLSLRGAVVELHSDEAYRGHPWFDALHTEGMARGIGAELRIRVVDVGMAHTEALALGGASVQPPFDDGPVRECQVMAPDGYLLGLWQPTPQAYS